VSDPELGLDVFIPIFVIFPILMYIFSKKYNWMHWKERLTGAIISKNDFENLNTSEIGVE